MRLNELLLLLLHLHRFSYFIDVMIPDSAEQLEIIDWHLAACNTTTLLLNWKQT